MPKTLRTQGLIVLAGATRGAEEKKAVPFNTFWPCGCAEGLFEATRLLSDHLFLGEGGKEGNASCTITP